MPNLQEKGIFNCNINIYAPQGLKSSSIPYEDYKLAEPNSWDGNTLPISLFSTNNFLDIDSKTISTSLLQMANFIWNKNIVGKIEKDIPSLVSFGQAAWSFISSIYEAGWNFLKTDDHNRMFH